MYFIRGNENYFIDEEVAKISNALQSQYGENFKVYLFSQQFNFEEVVDLISNTDIFSTNKLLIFKDLLWFNEKNAKVDKNLVDEFLYLISTAVSDSTIVFTNFQEKYAKTFKPSELYKFIEKNAKLIEVEKLSDRQIYAFVQKLIKSRGGTIDDFTLVELVSSLPNNLNLIENEITRLMLEKKEITPGMIANSNLSISSNISYAFSDAFIKFNSFSEIIKKLQEQLNYGIHPSQILAQIAQILSDCQRIYFLKKQAQSLDNIAKSLNLHIYRIKLLNSLLIKLEYSQVKRSLNELSKLDEDIKNDRIDGGLGLKIFLLNLINM
ncbi:DNA-directed DNA polymerase [Metamycoplasma arthritidis]|uniref:DNA polymerase III subunit delta n=1 Tax=Metamycoplasma arthritidis (strain 158L3-1) TaxID=243272 RepID=B3PMF3_META1|nr:DNA polymerase III, delta subunit [Metamycoplasma arthritidis]ACF07205.1 DNA polymerase III, delta subunit [Metamycoplasma arthritidis 158L3-1]VEU78729.1 DNA-directed DNA polymerase [Metamycoplasma arthritidis]